MQSGEGTILRLTKLTDTSLIVTWCVAGKGLVKTVAKGARRPKSAFSGKLDLFYRAELSWVESRKTELSTLREVEVVDYAQGMRRWYLNVVVAGYFAILVEDVLEMGQADEAFFELLVRAYGYLASGQCEKKGVLHFEKEMAKLLGVWDERKGGARSLQEAMGSLPRNRERCMEMFQDQ